MIFNEEIEFLMIVQVIASQPTIDMFHLLYLAKQEWRKCAATSRLLVSLVFAETRQRLSTIIRQFRKKFIL